MLVTTAISPSTMLVEFEPASEAHLDDRPSDLRLAEDQERGQRQEVEPGGVRRRSAVAPRGLVGVEGLGQRGGQRVLVDVVRPEAHPLRHPLDVRRPVPADVQARVREPRLDQRRDGPLAFGAGDVNGAKVLLRIAEPGGEIARGLEPDPHPIAWAALPIG